MGPRVMLAILCSALSERPDEWMDDMFPWFMSIVSGLLGALVAINMAFNDKHDYVQAQYVAFVAVLFATSIAFRALALWEREHE